MDSGMGCDFLCPDRNPLRQRAFAIHIVEIQPQTLGGRKLNQPPRSFLRELAPCFVRHDAPLHTSQHFGKFLLSHAEMLANEF